MNGTRILVTGASGFVGQRVCGLLKSLGAVVVTTSRSPSGQAEAIRVDALGPYTDWTDALAGCHAVVHLAARVHVMNERSANPLHEFRLANTQGTMALARQAAASGVKRLIFVSSIKVNGEFGNFNANSAPNPLDPYGVSKYEAEQQLLAFGKQSGLEIVVIRPPLIYGPGVKANFFKLFGAVARGIPLPFGAVNNRRSLLFVDNLASAIATCLSHPKAAGRTYLVSDNAEVSTAELVRKIACSLNRKVRLIPVSPSLIEWLATILGKRAAAQRLLGDLTVNPDAIRRELGWEPPYSMQAGLNETAKWFVQQKQLKIQS